MARRIIHIEIPWVWLRVGLFVAIEIPLIVAYHFQQDRDRAIILFLATTVAATFALYSYLRGIEERRIQEAGRAVERWNAPDRAEIRKTLRAICEGNINPATLARREKSESIEEELSDRRMHIFSALNFYEELAIGIFEDSIDEEKAYRFFSSIVEQTYVALHAWIGNEREIDNSHSYYIEFEKLAERWRLRRTY